MNLPIALPWKHAEWNSIDGGLLPVLVGIMRLCWIWPWMLLIQGFLSPSVAAPLMPPWMLVALPVLSFSMARWSMPTFSERRDLRRVTEVRRQIAGTGFVAILFVLWLRFLRPDFPLWDLRWLLEAGYDLIYWDAEPVEMPGAVVFLFIAIFLWLRGALDGKGQFRHEDVWKAFLSGGTALALFAWIIPSGGSASQPAATANPFSVAGGMSTNLVGLLLLFSAAGLAGLGAANLRKSGGWRSTTGLGNIRPNRSWLVGIGLTIGVLLAVALLIGLLVQPEDAAILFRGLGLIWRAISTVLVWIITIIAYPIFIIIEYLIELFKRLMGDRSQEQEQEFAGPPEPLEQLPEAPQRAVEAVPEPYRWIALLVVAVGVFIVFMLVLRQLRSHRRNETEELRESVFTTNLLQAQLTDLWARLRSRFGPAAEEPDPFLSLEGEIDTRRLIRSIYQRLLAVAQGRVAARLQAETPLRYGDRLSTHPDVDASLMQTITDAYVEARYGDEPPSQQTAEEVQRAWNEIESVLLSEETDDEP